MDEFPKNVFTCILILCYILILRTCLQICVCQFAHALVDPHYYAATVPFQSARNSHTKL
jgi:hypothetical protein